MSSPAAIRLQTPRLLLREWRDEDVEPFVEMNQDPDVTRFLRGGAGYTRDDTLALLGRIHQHWAGHGFGLFAAELRGAREFVGFIGIAVPEFLPEVLPSIEIGWRLARRVWGFGLATEGAREVMRWSFRDIGLGRLISVIHPDNTASIRVAEKIGMHPWLETVDPNHGHGLVVYEAFRGEADSPRG